MKGRDAAAWRTTGSFTNCFLLCSGVHSTLLNFQVATMTQQSSNKTPLLTPSLTEFDAATPYLEFHDIGKTFPGVKALDGISFNCYAGQIHALMGENGAGKSTLLKILSGNYQPSQGNIHIRGQQHTHAHHFYRPFRRSLCLGIPWSIRRAADTFSGTLCSGYLSPDRCERR